MKTSKIITLFLFLLTIYPSLGDELGVYKNTYNSGMAKVERLDQIETYLEKMSRDYQVLVNRSFKEIEEKIAKLENDKDKKDLTKSNSLTDLSKVKSDLSNEFDRKLDRLSQRLDEEIEKQKKAQDEQIVTLLERIVSLEKSILEIGTINR